MGRKKISPIIKFLTSKKFLMVFGVILFVLFVLAMIDIFTPATIFNLEIIADPIILE